MDRRAFLGALGFLLAPRTTAAQGTTRPRLCFLTFDPGTLRTTRFGAFFQGLRDRGYVDGQTLVVDYLSADGQGERVSAIAAECLRLNADIIVVTTTPIAQAAKSATRTIPIVMLPLGDPVGTGLVDSLGRPGGNVTGTTAISVGLSAKRLELLKEVAPRASRVLVLAYVVDPIAKSQLEELKKSAPSVGVQLYVQGIRSADDLVGAFAAGAKERADTLLVTSASIFAVHRARITELAARHRLPAMYSMRPFGDAGGLMVYDSDRVGLEAAAAMYVDKILKGARPAELPVQQPTKFELVINLKTAKALGLTISPLLLQRADQLIE